MSLGPANLSLGLSPSPSFCLRDTTGKRYISLNAPTSSYSIQDTDTDFVPVERDFGLETVNQRDGRPISVLFPVSLVSRTLMDA